MHWCIGVICFTACVCEHDDGFVKVSGRDMSWPIEHIPLGIDVSGLDAIWRDLIKREQDYYNKTVGIVLFSPTSIPFVVARQGRGLDRPGLTVVKHSTETGRIYDVDVMFDELTPENLRRTVVRHELGHVLGLDHDRYCEESVMYPFVSFGEELTDNDAGRLRHKYEKTN